jgi:coproporphyrinogen III oxidase
MTQATVKQDIYKNLRYKFYHDLDQLYHGFFDEIAQADIREGDAASLTQNILKARQDSLKYLLTEEELLEYEQNFPES